MLLEKFDLSKNWMLCMILSEFFWMVKYISEIYMLQNDCLILHGKILIASCCFKIRVFNMGRIQIWIGNEYIIKRASYKTWNIFNTFHAILKSRQFYGLAFFLQFFVLLMSCVKYFSFLFVRQSGEAYRWRVCHQQGLPLRCLYGNTGRGCWLPGWGRPPCMSRRLAEGEGERKGE